ncbi:hypothetical protein ACLB2K_047796 [Fragaria x ananassa]
MKVFPMRWEKIAAAVPGKTKAACAKSGGVEEGLSECQGCYRSIRSWMKQRERVAQNEFPMAEYLTIVSRDIESDRNAGTSNQSVAGAVGTYSLREDL